MYVRLKGINYTTKRLADGTIKRYARLGRGRGAIPLNAETRETLIATYNEALARKVTPVEGVLSALIRKFEESSAFTKKIVPRTQADYRRQFKLINREFGDLPLAKLPEARGMFQEWRDEIAERSLRQADAAWIALARVLSWALDRRYIAVNPCERGGGLYHGTRADKVWSSDQEAVFLATASAPLRLALTLAIWTGQRQGDLLKLPWSAWDRTATNKAAHGKIRLKQSKTGIGVEITVSAVLKAALDTAPCKSPIILLSSDGKPWTANGFSSSWRKACKKAGVTGVTFNDLRGTFVTRSAIKGATEAEIASATGHTLGQVRSILDKHYLCRDPALGENLMQKLESGTENAKPGCKPPRAGDHKGRKNMNKNQVAGGLGFEPRSAESESAVLPLDDPPVMPNIIQGDGLYSAGTDFTVRFPARSLLGSLSVRPSSRPIAALARRF